MKNNWKAILIVAIISMVAIHVNAQYTIGGPGTSTSGINANGTNGDSPVVPFDGGMSLLFAASGMGYAAKKLRKKSEV